MVFLLAFLLHCSELIIHVIIIIIITIIIIIIIIIIFFNQWSILEFAADFLYNA